MLSTFFIVLTVLMAIVIYFDATRFIIPNWLVGLVVAFWPPLLLISPYPVDWMMALATMAGVFAIGCFVFSRKWMGGGDIKLLTACSIWTGWPLVLDFLILMALIGGLLSVFFMGSRALLLKVKAPWAEQDKLPRLLRKGQPLPYGLAIAASFLLLLWQQKLPGLLLSAAL